MYRFATEESFDSLPVKVAHNKSASHAAQEQL
jgi:hypothetical protein